MFPVLLFLNGGTTFLPQKEPYLGGGSTETRGSSKECREDLCGVRLAVRMCSQGAPGPLGWSLVLCAKHKNGSLLQSHTFKMRDTTRLVLRPPFITNLPLILVHSGIYSVRPFDLVQNSVVILQPTHSHFMAITTLSDPQARALTQAGRGPGLSPAAACSLSLHEGRGCVF